MKKVALCISGESRHSMTAFPYLYDSFNNHDKESGYVIDVFYHTWKVNERVISLWNPKSVISESEDDAYQRCLKSVKIPIDYYKDKDPNISISRVYNNLLMFYGIDRVIAQTKSGNYDYIIRCRPDIILYEKINLIEIINSLDTSDTDIIIPNPIMNYSPDGYQDQFAIGKREPMLIYGSTYHNLTKIINESGRWYAEEFLKKHLDNHNIKVSQKEIYFQLCRNSSIVIPHNNIPPIGKEYLNK